MSKKLFQETFNPKTAERMANTKRFVKEMDDQDQKAQREYSEHLDEFLGRFNLLEDWQKELVKKSLEQNNKEQTKALLKSWLEISKEDEDYIDKF